MIPLIPLALSIEPNDIENHFFRKNIETVAWSPDGTRIATLFKRKLVFLPVDGGAPQPIAGAEPGEAPIAWSGDGKSLFVGALNPANMGVNVTRLEMTTGAEDFVLRRRWRIKVSR